MATQDIFENLVKDITAQVLQQIQQQAQSVIAEAVNQRIDALVNSNYISATIEDRINQAVIHYQPNLTAIDEGVREVVAQMGAGISNDLNVRVSQMIGQKVNEVDIISLMERHVQNSLSADRRKYPFPEKSIALSTVDLEGLTVTGDQVVGGVIKNFGSTGIDDQASECRVTILDQGTVFENTLYAPRIEVKGGAMIDGDLEIQGKIVDNSAYQQIVTDAAAVAKSEITASVLEEHQNLIFERILREGIDVSKISLNGRVIADSDRLLGVFNSQLRTVGVLQDLQTSGDTLLSDTLYVAGNRVGVNTMDPKNALSIWDEEVEIGFGKQKKGVARISAERETELILGSNDKDNITLRMDGSAHIQRLQLNNMMMTTAPSPPSYDAPKGSVVFNENPNLGGPLGWVSLGDARWANFGIID